MLDYTKNEWRAYTTMKKPQHNHHQIWSRVHQMKDGQVSIHIIYLDSIEEVMSLSMVGTVIIAVTWCSSIAFSTSKGWNFGIKMWHPPAISMAWAEEMPPIWHNGEVWRYTCSLGTIIIKKDLVQFAQKCQVMKILKQNKNRTSDSWKVRHSDADTTLAINDCLCRYFLIVLPRWSTMIQTINHT